MEDIKTAFKKFKFLCFLLLPKGLMLCWGNDKKTKEPDKSIYLGYSGEARPRKIFKPYEIKRVECSKPGIFKPGILTIIGQNDDVILNLQFKDKNNLKVMESFNYYLDLYKQYGLGKEN